MVYNRPFIKILAKSNNVYIDCVLPSLFKDIPNVYFIRHRDETFRTQNKQKLLETVKYVELPKVIHKVLSPYYTGVDLIESSLISYFYKMYGIPNHTKLEWDLPDFSSELDKFNLDIPTDRKIAIIRPNTIRAEWITTTRNAKPYYIAWCCKLLNELGYFTISIADVEPRHEWFEDGIENSAQLKLHKGQLGIYGTIGLIQKATIVVGSPGFIIPVTVSTNTNLYTIFGGRQSFDSPSKLFHPTMNMMKIGWANPDNPCRCTESIHDCDKTITNLESDFFKFLGNIDVSI